MKDTLTIREVELLVQKVEYMRWKEDLSYKIDTKDLNELVICRLKYKKPFNHLIKELNNVVPTELKQDIDYIREWCARDKQTPDTKVKVKLMELLDELLSINISIPEILRDSLMYYEIV